MSASYPSPDETTPLLPMNFDWEKALPSISEVTPDDESLYSFDFKHSFRAPRGQSGDNDNDRNVTIPAPVLAFELLVILRHLPLHKDPFERRMHEENSIYLFQKITSTIDPDDKRERQAEFGALLVYKFRLNPSASRRLCLLDQMHSVEVPEKIMTNVFLTQTIINLWKMGFTSQTFVPPASRIQRWDNIIRSPRNLHCIHLILHVSYLLSLSTLVLYLPSGLLDNPQDLVTTGLVIWIGLYGICNLVFEFEFSTLLLPFTAIFSVLSKLQPESPSHNLLLVTLSVHIIRMHFLGLPSHILLFEPQTVLPISAFFTRCMRYSLTPSFVLLLPMVIVFVVLLSLSLSGALLTFSGADVNNSPLSVRTGFLLFFALSVLMLICLFGALLVRIATSPGRILDSARWDKYGMEHGIAARRFLMRAIMKYSTCLDNSLSLSYPPPFNLAEYLLVPLGKKMVSQIDRRLWYFTVGPFAFVVAGIWLWGGNVYNN